MRVIWFIVILHTVCAQQGFGNPYLRDSRLCHQWTCINANLGLPITLPTKVDYATVLKSLLPEDWQNAATNVLETCFGDRPRRYSNTCPGQALLHCTLDQLIENCPEQYLRKDDACAPVSSLAGFNYMFSQSRYDDLEKNLPKERRPAWFLRNYFSSKCCNLPQLLNSTVLEGCGFHSILNYHTHEPRPNTAHTPITFTSYQPPVATTPSNDFDKVRVVDINSNDLDPLPDTDQVRVVDIATVEDHDVNIDPLDCCDITDLINESWRSECDFHLSWEGEERLTIRNDSFVTTTVPPTTTIKPKLHDVKIVPLSCEQETCVFRSLNIVSETGSVDKVAFSKLLDNLTSVHESWTKAKGRVVTQCLNRPLREYSDECEINKVMACTLDVLTENCPHAKKADPCKHTNTLKNDITCQISSSKYRPKNRRQFCGVPNLVNHEVLAQCGVNSLGRLEFVPDPPIASKPRKFGWWNNKFICKGSTDSTKCVMNKMGILNKYGFMDYFKMKDRIRRFTSDPAWSALTDIYLSAFSSMAMYDGFCSSPKKLLNVVDVMLTTCPVSKRKSTEQCNKIFNEMANTPPKQTQISKERRNQFVSRLQHVFLPHGMYTSLNDRFIPTTARTVKNPYFNFGILNSIGMPKVRILDLKPKTTNKTPLVILPVYLRMNGVGKGSVSIRPYRDNILRSAPLVNNNNGTSIDSVTIPKP